MNIEHVHCSLISNRAIRHQIYCDSKWRNRNHICAHSFQSQALFWVLMVHSLYCLHYVVVSIWRCLKNNAFTCMRMRKGKQLRKLRHRPQMGGFVHFCDAAACENNKFNGLFVIVVKFSICQFAIWTIFENDLLTPAFFLRQFFNSFRKCFNPYSTISS